MISTCPICQASNTIPVWFREASPIHQFLPAGGFPRSEDFAALQVVECGDCGHLWNRAFDPECLDRMYTSEHLTNVLVSSGMIHHLERILAWIGLECISGKQVIEVGGGSGALARMVARDAAKVTVVEPSQGIGGSDFSEPNILFLNEMFPPSIIVVPADLVICRQVLEHVPDPLRMLEDMVAALVPGGFMYLEVPSAEYIRNQAGLFDFHCAHVQYFTLSNLTRLAAKVGLSPMRTQALNMGRDFGILFARDKGLSIPENDSSSGRSEDCLRLRLRQRQEAFQAFFRKHTGGMVLYGATWNGLAFLNAFDQPAPFLAVLDDNQQYLDCALYHPTMVVPVVAAKGFQFDGVDTVIITAYHHAEAITRSLRNEGFRGKIVNAGETPNQTTL